jgi:hypothetical protein
LEIVDLPDGMNYADGEMEEMAEHFGVHDRHCVRLIKSMKSQKGSTFLTSSHTVNFY